MSTFYHSCKNFLSTISSSSTSGTRGPRSSQPSRRPPAVSSTPPMSPKHRIFTSGKRGSGPRSSPTLGGHFSRHWFRVRRPPRRKSDDVTTFTTASRPRTNFSPKETKTYFLEDSLIEKVDLPNCDISC